MLKWLATYVRQPLLCHEIKYHLFWALILRLHIQNSEVAIHLQYKYSNMLTFLLRICSRYSLMPCSVFVHRYKIITKDIRRGHGPKLSAVSIQIFIINHYNRSWHPKLLCNSDILFLYCNAVTIKQLLKIFWPHIFYCWSLSRIVKHINVYWLKIIDK